MSKSSQYLRSRLVPLAGVALLSAATIPLTGCVVRVVGPPPPPPAPVYVAPPPAPAAAVADAPPADADMQASEPPPPLPVYEQPPVPGPGYLWTPGYWAWAPAGYYWVPGTWVMPPRVGLLWTPGYWGFVGGVYAFHAGYWGPHVGFYGGVNYGFGYGGVGFAGGRWVGGAFAYNQSVTNVNVTVVHNTYNETVVNNVTVNRVSYNGGAGGVVATPTVQERGYAQEQHLAATPMQRQHFQQAANNPDLLARNNGGHPAIAATPHPGAFNAPGVVGAHGASTPPPHMTPAVANGNRPYGGPRQANGANAPHPQSANGKAPAQKQKAAKPHPNKENGRREPETALR
jgi:YXWGXW repeat-containing protein